ncbi:14804_t:CDS:2, partial [Gigaspora rosea]
FAPLFEELTLSHKVDEPENIEEHNSEIEFEDPEAPTSKTKIKFAKIISDLTEEKHNTPLQTRGNQKEKQVQTLEAYYYLEKLQEEFQDNPIISKEIRELIKSFLESARTNKIWKGTKWIYQVFKYLDLVKLYQAEHISISSLNEFSVDA